MLRYYGTDDPQIKQWADAHWDIWGVRIEECVALEPGRRVHHPSRPEDSRVPQQHDLNRSIYDLRLNSIGPSAESRSTRSISDADIDPVLQGSGQRNGVPLPSLKSSGLLDSWSTPGESRTKNVQPTDRKSPHLEIPRPVSSNMPVGMAWLADESNTPR